MACFPVIRSFCVDYTNEYKINEMTSEQSERSSYKQSCIVHLADIQAALNLYKNQKKLKLIFMVNIEPA